MAKLRGLTWDNDRALAPLLNTIDQYLLGHDEVAEIEWNARPLREFAHAPLEPLAREYDLIVFDHPHVGEAARSGILVPFDAHPWWTPDDLAGSVVAQSFESYIWKSQSWALPIDAACQVAARRADLVSVEALPAGPSWAEVLRYAAETPGRVLLPFTPVLACMCFLTLCSNLGDAPFRTRTEVAEQRVASNALLLLGELVRLSHPAGASLGDVEALELLGESDEVAYLPLVFGYSNYSRRGYRSRTVAFENIPSYSKTPTGAILGGAGIAVSSFSASPDEAARYAVWLTEENTQRREYVLSGGQPAHLGAWNDPSCDQIAGRFFSSTRASMDASYLRPRYPGFVRLQEQLGNLIHEWALAGAPSNQSLLREMNRQYLVSLDGPA